MAAGCGTSGPGVTETFRPRLAILVVAWMRLDAIRRRRPEARVARRIAGSAPGEAREAEAELYRLLAPRARRFGLRHLRDAHAASDLMQHVMTLTIEQLRSGRMREPERVLSFVLGACRLTVMDQRRGERRREDLLQRYADALPIADVNVAPRLDHERRCRLSRAPAGARTFGAGDDVLRRPACPKRWHGSWASRPATCA